MKNPFINTILLIAIAAGLWFTNVDMRESRKINRELMSTAAQRADEAVKLVKENTSALEALAETFKGVAQRPTYIQPLPDTITLRLKIATAVDNGVKMDSVPVPQIGPDGSLLLPFPQDDLPPVRPAEIDEPK